MSNDEKIQQTPDHEPEDRYRAFLPRATTKKRKKKKPPPLPRTAGGLQESYNHGNRLFAGISLSGVNLASSDLSDAQFGLGIFEETNFNGAILDRADFSATTLDNAQLENASLVAARFDDAELNGANLRGANLAAVQWSGACWDHETPPVLNTKTMLLPREWATDPAYTPDADAIINVNRQFDGLDDSMLDQMLAQINPRQRRQIEYMVYAPPLVLNLENWRERRKPVAAPPISPYSPR